MSSENIYLNVPFEEKEQAKILGAYWDGGRKQWYAPHSSQLAKIYKWFPEKIVTAPPALPTEFYSELPHKFALKLVRMGFTPESFGLLAQHLWDEGMQGDLSCDHRLHIIMRETSHWFPEINDEQIRRTFDEWHSREIMKRK